MGQKEVKEKEKTARETLGKFYYDLAKMTFGVMVLGNTAIVFKDADFELASVVLFVTGSIATWAFAAMGNKILKQ